AFRVPRLRRAASPHRPARRTLGPVGSRLRGLAGRGGTDLLADPAARAARRAPLALQGRERLRRLERAPGRARRARRAVGGRRVPPAARLLDRGVGTPRWSWRRRGPGALRPRVGGIARPRRVAGRAARRRRADLRRAGRRGPPDVARAVPRRRPGRRAPRRAGLRRPALGQPALRLARAAAPRVPLVDRAPAPHVRPLRRHPHRPLPGVRRLLGGAERGGDRGRRPLAARSGTCGLRRGRPRARHARSHRGRSRAHHRARHPVTPAARLSRDARDPVRLRSGRPGRPAPAGEPHLRPLDLRLHPRHGHRGRLVRRRVRRAARGARRGAGRGRDRGGGALLGAHPPGVRLAVPGRDARRPGRARAGLAGADERAGDEGPVVALEARARPAHRRARAAAACGDAGGEAAGGM
ncbi:MAG: GH77, partial [uncultured Solirubrobacteraceae bacterium]